MSGNNLNGVSSKVVLISRTGQLGDAVVSLPAMRAIRAGFPDHALVLLSTQHHDRRLVSPWEVFRQTGLFSGVIFHDPLPYKVGGWTSVLQLIVQIRRLKPEVLFYLREAPWDHIRRDRFFFHVLCGIRTSYGLEPNDPSFRRRHGLGSLIRLPSEVDRLLGVVARAGTPVPSPGDADFAVPISASERAQVDSLWGSADIPTGAPVIGLGAVSKMPAKRWPVERFVEVGRRVLAEFPAAWFVILGGPGDCHIGIVMRQALGDQVINAAGRLTVLESAEALRRCRLYVGNDTGIMHLAAAVGTPCVALFSARDHPGRWDPYGPNHVVFRNEPPCAGCLLQVCIDRDMVCLKDIQVDEVADAVLKVLRST